MSQLLAVDLTYLKTKLSPQIDNTDFSQVFRSGYESVLDPTCLWLIPAITAKTPGIVGFFRRIQTAVFIVCSTTGNIYLHENSMVITKDVALSDCDVGYHGDLIVKSSISSALSLLLEQHSILGVPKQDYLGFCIDNKVEGLRGTMTILYKITVPTEAGMSKGSWITPANLMNKMPEMNEISQILPTLISS